MYKQTIVIRADLKMGRGKLAAQSSHASLSSYKHVMRTDPDIARSWESEGQMKIVLKVGSEEELLEYYNKAKAIGIPCDSSVMPAIPKWNPGRSHASQRVLGMKESLIPSSGN